MDFIYHYIQTIRETVPFDETDLTNRIGISLNHFVLEDKILTDYRKDYK